MGWRRRCSYPAVTQETCPRPDRWALSPTGPRFAPLLVRNDVDCGWRRRGREIMPWLQSKSLRRSWCDSWPSSPRGDPSIESAQVRSILRWPGRASVGYRPVKRPDLPCAWQAPDPTRTATRRTRQRSGKCRLRWLGSRWPVWGHLLPLQHRQQVRIDQEVHLNGR